MDENTKNAQASEQQGQSSTEPQAEKLFTQADVDRIVGNRLARLKQEAGDIDRYRQERDDARKELEQYKNDAFLTSKGVKDIDKDYVTFKAAQLMNDNTNFQQAVEAFLKDNPRFAGVGFRIVSTGSSSVNHGNSGTTGADIRAAMGLKG